MYVYLLPQVIFIFLHLYLKTGSFAACLLSFFSAHHTCQILTSYEKIILSILFSVCLSLFSQQFYSRNCNNKSVISDHDTKKCYFPFFCHFYKFSFLLFCFEMLVFVLLSAYFYHPQLLNVCFLQLIFLFSLRRSPHFHAARYCKFVFKNIQFF